MTMLFYDRQDAGQKLAEKLVKYKNLDRVVVLGLPRGGVIVAAAVAQHLNVPLDIMVARKISAPRNPEFAIGAITVDGAGVFDDRLIASLGIPPTYINKTILQEQREAHRRLQVYRGDRPALDLQQKIVVLVDDGIATGATMQAAINFVKKQQPQKIIVAVPVAAPDTCAKLKKNIDELITLATPRAFAAVGQFYKKFDQTTDDEVVKIMQNTNTY